MVSPGPRLPEDAIQAAEHLASKYGQLMALSGRLSDALMAALRELDGTLKMAEHVLAGTPVGAGAHSTICGFILNAYASGRAEGARAEREAIRKTLVEGDPGRLEQAFRAVVYDDEAADCAGIVADLLDGEQP
jgi:hypothetical protein